MFCDSGNKKLDAAVNNWLRIDKNPVTRQEVLDDIENARWDKLSKVMLSRQKFGTAGLRGAMAAGYKCMNDVVVLQTAQGLCSYLLKECCKGELRKGLVIGYDGRYNSKRFAELTAKVFISNSVPVDMFSCVCPTPLVSFASATLDAPAAVMVTASHNPKEDNGYKVYYGNGSQIITPHDDGVLEEILQCLEIPDEHWDIEGVRSHELVRDCTEEMTKQYMQYIRDCLPQSVLEENKSAGIKTVYSAMHGVGYDYIVKAFAYANLKEPVSVKEQQDPDPEFPTVRFPNPEEVQCLELSQKLAEENGVRLVLVNDPDADRLAVAEYNLEDKSWKIFNGNEMGALLCWWLLKLHLDSGSREKVYVLGSIVSTNMLKAIIGEHGQYVQTLTGFKWMGNTALLLEEEGRKTLFAFEEAIGYMCNQRVPEKDGVSAAVQVASLATYLYTRGSSLVQKLSELYSKHGYYVSHNAYYLCYEPATVQSIFRKIRNYGGPGIYPTKIGECEIVYLRDMVTGVIIPDEENGGDGFHLNILGTGLDLEYKSGEMIMFRCSNGLSVTIRTSGTEPKIKYYSEFVAKADTPSERKAVKVKLEQMVREFVEELLQPKKNGLLS